MSMNRSSASSFDPLSYYKKLTQCLAQKTNTKVRNSMIPGLQKEKRISRPLITKQHLQAKFLAKYNKDKKQETSQGAKNSTERNVSQKNIPIAFKVKTTQDVGPSKRRKPQEIYINLPPSFFKSFEGPDMSMFKVPEVPPIVKKTINSGSQREKNKVLKNPSQNGNSFNNKFQYGGAQKKQRDPDAYINLSPSFFETFRRPAVPKPPPSVAMTDTTLGSVSSAKFQPGQASTPIEKHAPMISDPDEMFTSFPHNKQKVPSPPSREISFRRKANKVLKLADKVSKNIDVKGFGDHPDPTEEILRRVMDIYEISCQSPRLINETLMSSYEMENSVPSEASNSPQSPPPRYSLPIPEFFEQTNDKVEHRATSQQHLERTSDIFKLSAKIMPINNSFETPSVDFDGIFSSQFTFNNSPERFSCASQELSPFSQPSPMNQSFNFESPMVVECDPFTFISPLMDISMDWESPDDFNNNTFAIFHSPPDTRPRNVRPSQRSKHSQRELSIHETFNSHPDSSLSTYKWTPHINQPPPGMSQSSSSSALFEPYRPRNIFHNSFDLF